MVPCSFGAGVARSAATEAGIGLGLKVGGLGPRGHSP